MLIPLTTFNGYLKQMNNSDWNEDRRHLFDFLFPLFGDKKEYTEPTMSPRERIEHELVKGLIAALSPLIQVQHDPNQPRRFAGPSLPRRRYFSVCRNNFGDDQNTLVHELRAYRDAQRSGMVEVIDLGVGEQLTLGVGSDEFTFSRSMEIGVLVHEPSRLPHEFETLVTDKFKQQKGEDLWMFRFPYGIYQQTIENVVDLRVPETRARFHDYFSKPQQGSAIIWPEQSQMIEAPIIALSRFRLVAGRAPRPKDFYHMLPTLMNPDIGGGVPSSTGSTIQAIGTWMRHNSVSALIYPSARCDVFVKTENGRVQDFGGWNLVDYRSIEVDKTMKAFYSDHSPWCWVKFPPKVSIGVVQAGSKEDGSFSFDGIVNYWAEDYLELVRSLGVVKSVLKLRTTDVRSGLEAISYYETWKIGLYISRWLQLVLSRSSEEEIREAILVLKGLGARYGLIYPLGKVDEIVEDLSNKFDPNDALRSCVTLSDKVADIFEKRGQKDHEQLVTVAGNFELLMLYLSMGVRGQNSSKDAIDIQKFTHLPLTDQLRQRLQSFVTSASIYIAGKGKDNRNYHDEGHRLESDISTYLMEKSSL